MAGGCMEHARWPAALECQQRGRALARCDCDRRLGPLQHLEQAGAGGHGDAHDDALRHACG